MAKVQLVSVVRDIDEDWRAGMAREGKIGMSREGTFAAAKGGRTVLQCERGRQAVWESSYCLRLCKWKGGREPAPFYFKGCYGG